MISIFNFATIKRAFVPGSNLSSLTWLNWQKVLKAKLTKPGDFRGRRHFDLNLGHLKVTWSRVMAKFIQQNNTSASYTSRQRVLLQLNCRF